jgi:hypothetical protein
MQMGALLELLKVEQNIYNIVFHELIRQVSVNCAERGLLLDRIRSEPQSDGPTEPQIKQQFNLNDMWILEPHRHRPEKPNTSKFDFI